MEIMGNGDFLSLVTSKIKTRTIPHAYLFTGPLGSGKKLLARYIAKALCCLSEDKPCDKCNACKKADLSVHPDIHFLEKDPDKNIISVASVREFIKGINFTPNESDYKVYIIADAETMGKEAQNVLLKTLEEPVGSTVFMLLSQSESAILPTVRSRCVCVQTEPINREVLKKHLCEKFNIDGETAEKAVKISGGYVGAAYNCLEKKGGFEIRNIAEEFLLLIASGDKVSATAKLSAKSITKDKLSAIYTQLQLAMRDIAARQYGAENGDFFIHNEDSEKIRRKFTQIKAISLYDVLEEEKATLAMSGNTALSVLRIIGKL